MRAWRRDHLPDQLIVSLTSYSGRLATLHKTLTCLSNQSFTPHRIWLWLSAADAADVRPEALAIWRSRRVEIRTCDDIGSYAKLVPSLDEAPSAIVVTADDDVFYPRHWLLRLVEGHRRFPGSIVCHRAHRIKYGSDGRPCPYMDWDHDVQDGAARVPSVDLIPTGVGGVLYPPGCLHGEVAGRETFLDLCPSGDDIWFYWMARMAGTKAVKIGREFEERYWPGTQKVAMWQSNMRDRNDVMITRMWDAYGSPLDHPAS